MFCQIFSVKFVSYSILNICQHWQSRSFVCFIRVDSRLLAVFRHAFNRRQH